MRPPESRGFRTHICAFVNPFSLKPSTSKQLRLFLNGFSANKKGPSLGAVLPKLESGKENKFNLLPDLLSFGVPHIPSCCANVAILHEKSMNSHEPRVETGTTDLEKLFLLSE